MKSIVRIFILTASFWGLLTHALADVPSRSVDRQTAEQVAINWMIQSGAPPDFSLAVRQTETIHHETHALIYIIYFEKQGFVMVAADKHVQPVLAYSLASHADPDDLPPAARVFIGDYKKQIKQVISNDIRNESRVQEWEKLKRGNKPRTVISGVSMLLSTTWGQDIFYNASCPEDEDGPGGHALAGCVATAMAQVFRYWEHPDTGVGDNSYWHLNYGTIHADFSGTTHDYSQMPNNINDHNQAIADLMFHAGVSVNMLYGVDWSLAWPWNIPDAIADYFKYSETANFKWRSGYLDGEWTNMIRQQLRKSKPIIYAGREDIIDTNAHAFVIDGYEYDGNNYMYHVNMGWRGSHNGYYCIDYIAKPDTFDFTYNHNAVMDIIPVLSGSGTADDPWQIFNTQQLSVIREHLNDPDVHFILMNDIAFPDHSKSSGSGWLPIGLDGDVFRGHLDGNGYVIENLYINRSDILFAGNDAGLFSSLSGATIKNLGIVNADISARKNAGVLAGSARYTEVINVHSSGTLHSTVYPNTRSFAGGLIGFMEASTVKDSYSFVEVHADGSHAGGLVGFSNRSMAPSHDGSTIESSYTGGLVVGTEKVGGLVGDNRNSKIINSYSWADVEGELWVGGLVGHNNMGYGSPVAVLSNTYTLGTVTGQEDVGGVLGFNDENAIISHSNTEADVTGSVNVGGLVGSNKNAMILHSGSEANVSGGNNVGGLVGQVINTHIQDCHGGGEVSGDVNVGGLAGNIKSSIIHTCHSDGMVAGAENVGGLVGYGQSQSSIINAHSTAEVTGTAENAGGIAGQISVSLIEGCSYEGEITGNNNLGGIVGYSGRSVIKSCQVDMIIHGNNRIGGLAGFIRGSIVDASQAAGIIYANNTVGGLVGSSWIYETYHSDVMNSQSSMDIYGNNGVGGITGYTGGSNINNCGSSGIIQGNQKVGGLTGSLVGGVILNSNSSSPVTGTGEMVGGLVGETSDTSVISHCESSGPVQGAGSVGGLVGMTRRESTTIELSTSTGDVTNSWLYTGGLVGYAFPNVTIQASSSEGNVTGITYTGGLIGFADESATINNSSASGSIEGTNFTGGLAGYIYRYSSITNSFFNGEVTGEDRVGGLTGENYNTDIYNSGSTGSVFGNQYVGGLTGESWTSDINNSFSTSQVTATSRAGGLIGLAVSTNIYQCYSSGDLNGGGALGGLVGWNAQNSSIMESYSISNVTGTGNSIGGLAGSNSQATIENCYATGDVQGTNFVGGLIGDISGNSTLLKSYSTGNVSGTSHFVGGLVGVKYESQISNSYWNLETSGMDASAGGEGLMVNEMIQQQSFEDWDFATCWNIEEDLSYPYLRWQDDPGEHNYPPEYYTLTMLEPIGQGTVVPEPGNHEYLDGAIAEIAAFPELGYVFSHWVGDVHNALEASTSITMNENKEVWAVFNEFTAAGIPFFEDFNGLEWLAIPDYWARTHDHWGAGSSDFDVHDELEMHFMPPWPPETGAFMLITPKLDGTGHSIINLTFRHALNDWVGGYSLKVQASVDGETWATHWQHDVPPSAKDAIPGQHAETHQNPEKASIPDSELIVDLSNMAGEMFYIAFVFDGYTGDTWGWYIDDVLVTNQQLFYKPTNLTAQEVDGQVDLLWNAPPDDSNIGYNVYRNGIKLNPDPVNITSFTDPQTETGVEYYYHVTALYADGESDPSNTVKIFRFEGSGTAEDPWLVATAVDLDNVRNYLGPQHGDKHFRQTANIDLGVSPWNDIPGWDPIGFFDMDMFEFNEFSGTYDGDYFVIDGLYIFRFTSNEVGLFGYLDGAVIKNLGITSANVTGNFNVGILAGEIDQSTIENCFTTGYAMAQQMRAGGLAGSGKMSTINNSYSRAMVMANGDHAAGLIASAFQSTIENSFSAGLVYTSGTSGGLISWAFNLQVINSYWDAETSQQTESAGGESRTTAQMTHPYDENTYVDWDFESVWAADPGYQHNSGYPWLQVTETFIITATTGIGGSITPSGDVQVPHGKNQAFVIAADAGYLIEDVVVDGQSIGPTSHYFFGHVVANHTIHAEFSVIAIEIPDFVFVDEYVLHDGDDDCINAYKTIQLGGNDGHFIVNDGGSVTLIAGQSIKMLPGTHVKEGGYMHAYIAPDGPFCEQFDKHFLAVDDNRAGEAEHVNNPDFNDYDPDDAFITSHSDDIRELDFIVYPNPGKDVFILEFTGYQKNLDFTIEIYSLCGTLVKRTFRQQSFNLANHKPGIYFVRVIKGELVKTVRIVKT